jgi:signal transduction histidine kinase
MSLTTELSWRTHDSEADLGSLFANAPFWLVQCDAEGKLITLNPELERILDESPRIQRPCRFTDLLDPEDGSKAQRLIGEIFNISRDNVRFDARTCLADHRVRRWTAWRAATLDGRSDSVFILGEQVDEDWDQHLRQAMRLETVGRLAGGVAHDFNNLLTGVLLYCDLLLNNLEQDEARKYAEEIRNASLQAAGVVRQLLSISRPNKSEIRQCWLNEVVEGMSDLLSRLVGERIALETRLKASLGPVKLSPTEAQQILLNFVLNARDAIPEGGGQITIETSNYRVQVLPESSAENGNCAWPCVLLMVEDNGNGMDAVTRAHLFEPFFTTKGSKGMGLGLSTLHDIVTGSGGLIYVDSAPARGTRMTVLLPLATTAAGNFESLLHPLPQITTCSRILEGNELL